MSRDEVFARVRASLADVPIADPPADVPVEWEYGQPTAVTDPLGLFIERVIDYRATVEKVADTDGIAAAVARFLVEVDAKSCAIPVGVDAAWVAKAEAAGVVTLRDDPPLSKETLDATSAVLTASCVGMAETGTIVLDHRPDQGRRILSLLPDTHICVIFADQITTDVPQALVLLEPSIREGLPVTWISGPSATSDIELSRVEGVHGPRNLYVIIVE
jgi:L-lactate dehydrogenase complex protein LldG